MILSWIKKKLEYGINIFSVYNPNKGSEDSPSDLVASFSLLYYHSFCMKVALSWQALVANLASRNLLLLLLLLICIVF